MAKTKLAASDFKQLLGILEKRFATNTKRHKELDWKK
jgi:hypothetical protein